MTEGVLVALIAGVFGLLAELLRRGTRDKTAHDAMATQLAEVAATTHETRRDVGGLRAELRAARDRVDYLDRRIDLLGATRPSGKDTP